MEEEVDILEKLNSIQYSIEKNDPREITVLGKKFKLIDVPRYTMSKIVGLALKSRLKVDIEDPEEVYQQYKKSGNLDVKVASLLILGSSLKVFLFHWIHWRYLYYKYSTESMSAIIENGFNNAETLFFYKNLISIVNVMKSRTMMMNPSQKQ